MLSRQEFFHLLWKSIGDHTSYAWLNPQINLKKKDSIPEVLIPAKFASPLLKQMRELSGAAACRASFNYGNTIAVFAAEDWNVTINFQHRFVSKTLYFMEEERVIKHRVSKEGMPVMASVEHLLEYCLLRRYLQGRGISQEDFRYFNDFHFLIKEDLIEFLNDKYLTDFRNIHSMTEFDPAYKRNIILQLRKMPFNRLSHTVNIRWHNFLGTVRRDARMI